MALKLTQQPAKAGTGSIGSQIESIQANTPKAAAGREEKTDDTTVVSVRMPKALKTELKVLFARHGMTLSDGIKRGMDCLLYLEKLGDIIVTNTQIIPNKR